VCLALSRRHRVHGLWIYCANPSRQRRTAREPQYRRTRGSLGFVDLQRDVDSNFRVIRLKNESHTSFTELPKDAEPAVENVPLLERARRWNRIGIELVLQNWRFQITPCMCVGFEKPNDLRLKIRVALRSCDYKCVPFIGR
jgi:hypothetical protein